jgi:hypothetical protein
MRSSSIAATARRWPSTAPRCATWCSTSLSEIFPELRLATDAGSHWKTTAGGVMYATGTGGTITGRRGQAP